MRIVDKGSAWFVLVVVMFALLVFAPKLFIAFVALFAVGLIWWIMPKRRNHDY